MDLKLPKSTGKTLKFCTERRVSSKPSNLRERNKKNFFQSLDLPIKDCKKFQKRYDET